MNKETLIKLMQERDLTYPDFLQRAKANTSSTQWGMGIGAPYSLEPYRMELLGIKPGRMLKKISKPAPNRFCYSFDNQGRVIYKIGYASLGGPQSDQAWIHSDDFYEYEGKYATRYVFGSVFRGGEDAKLHRIVCAELKNKKIIKTVQLERDNYEYTEEFYQYDNDGNIIDIRLMWPENLNHQRVFKILHETKGIRILEIDKDGETQIYPE
jgi:hypothetical protein